MNELVLMFLQAKHDMTAAQVAPLCHARDFEVQSDQDDTAVTQDTMMGDSSISTVKSLGHSLSPTARRLPEQTAIFEGRAAASTGENDPELVPVVQAVGEATPPATMAVSPPRPGPQASETLSSPDAASLNVFSNPLYSIAR